MLATAQVFRSLLGGQSSATKEAMRRAVLASLDNIPKELEDKITAEIEAGGAAEPPAMPFSGNEDDEEDEEVGKKSKE
jgi:hypothetical protein